MTVNLWLTSYRSWVLLSATCVACSPAVTLVAWHYAKIVAGVLNKCALSAVSLLVPWGHYAGYWLPIPRRQSFPAYARGCLSWILARLRSEGTQKCLFVVVSAPSAPTTVQTLSVSASSAASFICSAQIYSRTEAFGFTTALCERSDRWTAGFVDYSEKLSSLSAPSCIWTFTVIVRGKQYNESKNKNRKQQSVIY